MVENTPIIIAPEEGFYAVGSKFDVRQMSVVRLLVFWDHFLGHVNPYLVPESAFVLVSFWVILAQDEPKDLSDVCHVTQFLTGLTHALD